MPATWSNELLDRMRQVGDPPADQVVAALAEQGQIESVNQLMHNLVHNDTPPPDSLPPEIREHGVTPVSTEHGVTVHVGMSLADAEQRLIVATLSHFDGSKTKAAEVLGISLKTLYNRLEKYRKHKLA